MLAALKVLFVNFVLIIYAETGDSLRKKTCQCVWRVFFCAYTIRYDIAALQAGLQRYMNRLRA